MVNDAKPLRWRIYRLRATPAQYLGEVEAPNELEAINAGIEKFKVAPAHRDRLMAQRML